MGYGNGVIKPQQSIHFGFKTTKPNEDDIKTLIKVFIESESW